MTIPVLTSYVASSLFAVNHSPCRLIPPCPHPKRRRSPRLTRSDPDRSADTPKQRPRVPERTRACARHVMQVVGILNGRDRGDHLTRTRAEHRNRSQLPRAYDHTVIGLVECHRGILSRGQRPSRERLSGTVDHHDLFQAGYAHAHTSKWHRVATVPVVECLL